MFVNIWPRREQVEGDRLFPFEKRIEDKLQRFRLEQEEVAFFVFPSLVTIEQGMIAQLPSRDGISRQRQSHQAHTVRSEGLNPELLLHQH